MNTMATNIDLIKELLQTKLDSLDEKIDSNNKTINAKIDSNNQHVVEMLSFIREQTTRTNGRVTKAEEDIRKLSAADSNYLVNYPGKDQINKINEKLEILDEQNLIIKVWNKYPKALVFGIVVAVIIVIGGLSYTLISVHDVLRRIKTEEKHMENLTSENTINNENAYQFMAENN